MPLWIRTTIWRDLKLGPACYNATRASPNAVYGDIAFDSITVLDAIMEPPKAHEDAGNAFRVCECEQQIPSYTSSNPLFEPCHGPFV